MQRFFRYLFFFTFILLPLMAPAQRKGRPKTKAQLEREKRENLRKIKEATRILNKP